MSRKKISRIEQHRKRLRRLEESIAQLQYIAEHWSVTGVPLYDLRCRRQELLSAGRRYGDALRALSRRS